MADMSPLQVHLVSQEVSWGSLDQIVCALRFFYGVTLIEPTVPERISTPAQAAGGVER